jgi:hypothetical protein
MNESTSLWNKRAEDITVGDAVKINIIVMAVMVVPVVAGVGYGVVRDKLAARKARKLEALTVIDTTAEEAA